MPGRITFTGVEKSLMSTATRTKPKLRITPLEDQVVVAPDTEAETLRGGLFIPDTAKEKPTQGRVLAVGAGRFERGARIPLDVKVGDTVLYGKYNGTNITLEGDEVMIIRASDILAKLG
jgi:chaperonin GroES